MAYRGGVRRRWVMSQVLLWSLALSAIPATAADYLVRPLPFTEVTLTDGLWGQRQETNRRVTLPFAIDQCESSQRLRNFDLAAETLARRAKGETLFSNTPATPFPFDDSDVFKVVEGAAYCLTLRPDPDLQKRLADIVLRIAAAQEPDGYLYTFRTMHPDSPVNKRLDIKRWLKDPQASHELYNIGHLYEAGVAHAQATRSNLLLDVCLKNAELLHRDFADGGLRIAPGHPGIEMALAKLSSRTGDARWLSLAQIFLDARGTTKLPSNQNHKPVLEQREAVGHAVRANYLYSGMADVAALKGDPRYLTAITAIWEDVVGRKLHITGGCGALSNGEAYGEAYQLPHRCYNETCAAIAFLFWNHRMFLLSGDGKYMDVFERTLYNGFLSGVSLSGDRFFYPNPLEYDGKEAFNHDHAGRAPWFGCACCPPNILRMMASLGGYVIGVKDDRLYLNLYAQGEATVTVAGCPLKLFQQTNYPWDETITLRIEPKATKSFCLCLRIPGWVRGRPVPSDLYAFRDSTPSEWTVSVNGELLSPTLEEGYAEIQREWSAGDVVTLKLPMPVRRVTGNRQIEATRGKVALERGPIVYCLEGIDNDKTVSDLSLPDEAKVTAAFQGDLLGGVTVLTATAARVNRTPGDKTQQTPAPIVAVPYAFWNNRGQSEMTVWIGRDK